MTGTAAPATPEASGAHPNRKRDPIGKVGNALYSHVITPIWKRITGVLGGLWHATGEQLGNEGTNLREGLGIPESKEKKPIEARIQSVRSKVTKALGWIGGVPGRAVGYTAGLALAPVQYGARGVKAVWRGLITGESGGGTETKKGHAGGEAAEPTPHPA